MPQAKLSVNNLGYANGDKKKKAEESMMKKNNSKNDYIFSKTKEELKQTNPSEASWTTKKKTRQLNVTHLKMIFPAIFNPHHDGVIEIWSISQPPLSLQAEYHLRPQDSKFQVAKQNQVTVIELFTIDQQIIS